MKSKMLVVGFGVVSFMGLAEPFGEAVNCREETTVQKIYGGQVSCEDTYKQTSCKPINSRSIEITTQTKIETLTGFANDTTDSKMVLSKIIKVPHSTGAGPGACTVPTNVSVYLTCTADIPYLRDELLRKSVCDYKPIVSIVNGARTVHGQGLKSGGKDYDGSIVTYLWEVNGQFFSNAADIVLPHSNYQSSTYHVRHTVTDNSGYSTSTEQVVSFPNDECSTQACKNR